MKKPIRTLIALLAAAVIVLSFAACGKTSGTNPTDPTATAESVSASDTSAAPSTSAAAGTIAAATPADTARAALSEAIAGARAYYDSIKDDEALAEIADDLDTRLQRAEALAGSTGATQEELATALSDVAAALNVAKEMAGAGDAADAAGTDADSQNPVMNYIGVYECDRCSITVEADGATDAKITVHWGSSATEATVWTMSGRFDPDTKRINYSDSTKTVMNFEGEEEKDTVVYENGVGRIQFLDDGKLEWQDEREVENVRGMVFESIG